MNDFNYNQQLIKLREDKEISVKQAAKGIGISSFRLFLFEAGYFRPKGKTLEKIEAFYESKIDFEGEKDYPGEIVVTPHRKPKSRKKKLIASGSVTLTTLALIIAGTFIFMSGAKNTASAYGHTYQLMRAETMRVGSVGTDMVTGLKYYHVDSESEVISSAEHYSIIFYDRDSIMYFNECNYSINLAPYDKYPEIGTCRYHYRFGGRLGQNSYICYFELGSISTNAHITAEFLFDGKPATHLNTYEVKLSGGLDFNEEFIVGLINGQLMEAIESFNKLLTKTVGKEIDFYKDFLKDREIGRKVNFTRQMVGLSFLVPSVVIFFVAFSYFAYLSLSKRQASLINSEEAEDEVVGEKKPLPKDFHIPFAIPDYLVLKIGTASMILAIIFLILGFLGKVGVSALAVFANDGFMKAMKMTFVAVPFLRQFILVNSFKKEKELFYEILFSFLIYFIIATIETVIAGIAGVWGYDFTNLIYQYIPGSMFQVLVLHYLIYLFLFFQPKFIEKRGGAPLVIWRLCSLLPVGLLVASSLISNGYNLFYGVQKNIYISFWFPQATISISIVFIVFIYTMFFYRQHLYKTYGKRGTAFFIHSDRYMSILNTVYIALVLFIVVLTIILRKDQLAYYLGFAFDPWLLAFIPIMLLSKSAPSTVELYQYDEPLN